MRWTTRSAERAALARQEQRAEIAAHLHDSVLQTLALIQNRAGASSEVARIARAQERELRDWLFAGDAPVADDLAHRAARHRRRASSSTTRCASRSSPSGESVPGAASLVAATREAMLNAARHAGGDGLGLRRDVRRRRSTSSCAIAAPDSISDALPGDRLGIRESIIGRMTRAGGIGDGSARSGRPAPRSTCTWRWTA